MGDIDRGYRFEEHILAQMRYLANRGVIPNWENFRSFGDLWVLVRKHLNKPEQARYRWTWMILYKETMPAPTVTDQK